MEINYLAVLVCGILAMVVGGIWYGPLFGKKWMEIMGINAADMEVRKKMSPPQRDHPTRSGWQKAAGPLYLVQFVLVLFQAYVLSYYISGMTDKPSADSPAFVHTVLIWAAFIMPTVAGSCMWTNDSSQVKWTKFFLQTGYQLVIFVLFGIVLGMWR